MDASIRNTPSLLGKINKLRDELIRRFESLIGLAAIERNDRNTTAVTQYQMQVETAALIRTVEEAQSLIRQLQEMWLFGQLDTTGNSTVKQQSDEDAKAVAGLLQQLSQTPFINTTDTIMS